MNHQDHVRLLRGGVVPGGMWADLGAGRGAFTLALAELLGAGGTIYAVDRDAAALAELVSSMRVRAPAVQLVTITADFTRPLNLEPLDGLVMANSLHYVEYKEELVAQIRKYLRPAGRLIVVEYDTEHGNRWVPYPLAYPAWYRLAERVGFEKTELLATAPSSFLGRFYAAMSLAPGKR